jgi:hypothetical protein
VLYKIKTADTSPVFPSHSLLGGTGAQHGRPENDFVSAFSRLFFSFLRRHGHRCIDTYRAAEIRRWRRRNEAGRGPRNLPLPSTFGSTPSLPSDNAATTRAQSGDTHAQERQSSRPRVAAPFRVAGLIRATETRRARPTMPAACATATRVLKIDKNRLVFMVFDKISPIRFWKSILFNPWRNGHNGDGFTACGRCSVRGFVRVGFTWGRDQNVWTRWAQTETSTTLSAAAGSMQIYLESLPFSTLDGSLLHITLVRLIAVDLFVVVETLGIVWCAPP